MDWDPPKTTSTLTLTLGEDLSNHSVAELADRIAQLRGEIARAETISIAKKKHVSAADELFGKPR